MTMKLLCKITSLSEKFHDRFFAPKPKLSSSMEALDLDVSVEDLNSALSSQKKKCLTNYFKYSKLGRLL